MHVAHLWLRDFRNYASAELVLDAGAHVFVGSNGQGKTNLIEAIGYLAHLRSHRVSSDAALVRRGSEAAFVRAELAHERRRMRIDVRIAKSGANRAHVGERTVRSRELPQYLTTVLFAPEDLSLVRGDPGQRRDFLDALLATHSPRVGRVIADYDRVLKQRNSLLRSGRSVPSNKSGSQLSTLEVWDERLVELGTEIIAERLVLVEQLAPHLTEAYGRLVGGDHGVGLELRVTALGQSPVATIDDGDTDGVDAVAAGAIEYEELRERFASRLRDSRQQELDRGQSLVGPHRDDAVLMLNGLPARTTASHGESWSFALALKLAAAELVRGASRAGDPVLILDDVFAELDTGRRSRLADAVGAFEQVLITAAVLEDVPPALQGRVTHIHDGVIGGESPMTGEPPGAEAGQEGSA
ncbi:DNA replication and repair protein RecF [Pseudoclavibacter endophyticus]|uniref:DNA replication and repair protein RecF n=1 Tax=Pseudoclavibacter endophyticus TaxID=1778590 RepID=A0A6H9WLT9_9MICO|nr:DNA replication/repair protein RecF [Pseudoclavibacter endophyticus]KAB1648771.1 DNA replication/repair protein RecF [Pseudoclavibacter endophyticus]GGA68639.1 DNA replication and repair protein RecF [Pseudoclavibacter endophyticus]